MRIVFTRLSLAVTVSLFLAQTTIGGEFLALADSGIDDDQLNLRKCDQKDLRAKRKCVRDQIEILQGEEEKLTATINSAEPGEKPDDRKEGILDPLAKLLDNLLTRPKEIGLEIFRSLEEDGRPAVFGWSHEGGSEKSYLVDSAMRLSRPAIVKGALDNKLYMDLNLGFEAHASSASANRESNSLKWTFGTEGVVHHTGQRTWSPAERRFIEERGIDPGELGAPGINLLFTTNVFSELNPSTRLANIGGEIVTSVNFYPIGIGRYLNDPFKIVAFRWRPYIGIEGGGRIANGNGKEKEDSAFGRLTARLRADLRLDFLSKRLLASADYRYWNRFSFTPRSRGIGTVSLNYKMSDHVYLGGSYEEGSRPPSFGKVQRLGAELGVQY